jgi:hypothetical protein
MSAISKLFASKTIVPPANVATSQGMNTATNPSPSNQGGNGAAGDGSGMSTLGAALAA